MKAHNIRRTKVQTPHNKNLKVNILSHEKCVQARKHFDWLSKELQIQKQEDWYNITTSRVVQKGGRHLLDEFDGSLQIGLKTCYSEFEWKPWRFSHVPSNYWQHISNSRLYFDSLAEELGIQTQQEWYNVHSEATQELFGILSSFNHSLSLALEQTYPEFIWNAWNFTHAPRNLWTSEEIKNRFFVSLAEELGLETHSDLYKISRLDVVKHGGEALLNQYNGSLIAAFQSVFGQFDWYPWLFEKSPRNFWSNRQNQRNLFDWIAEQLGVVEQSDWHALSFSQISEFGGSRVLALYNWSLLDTLRSIYPEYEWSKIPELSEGQLKATEFLKTLFEDLKINHRMDMGGSFTELDVYIPSLSIAFEYQGRQHYKRLESSTFGSHEERVMRDKQKKELCDKLGISLIDIPYWWDSSSASLLATIRQLRPDAILSTASTDVPTITSSI